MLDRPDQKDRTIPGPQGHGDGGGNRKRRNPALPKGRQLDDTALSQVRALLANEIDRFGEPKRDRLIEYLHLIQDEYRCLSAAHIRALAEEMRLSQVEIYEVASFYDHFDVVKEGQAAPPEVTIRVCDGVACMMAGAEQLISELEAGTDPANVRVLRAPCMGGCDVAPAIRAGDLEMGHATTAKIQAALDANQLDALAPNYKGLAAYRADGGYALWDKVRSGELSPDAIIETLSDSGLRGLGGAGFPTGKKWGFVRGYEGPRLMTINGDEGEPGTFKDRYYLERNPHAMLEGALIAAACVEAERCYIYMRDEYPAVLNILRDEIAAVEAAGLADPGFFELRRGAGAYICGEESAMIESIEGKRGLPRHRPPFIAQVGVFGRPTLNNNVETLYWVPSILEKGVDWFRDQGTPEHPGMRSYSVSGRVAKPGVIVAPAGSSVNDLIALCGGMLDGHSFKAYLPGGASGGILPASKGDVPLDFGGELAELGSFVGSHAIVVFSDADSMRDVTLNLVDFFTHESCGQCTPCRGGTEKMGKLLRSGEGLDEDTITDLEAVMRDASICGLGQAAPNPVRHLLTHFRDDLT
ncbi:MAG: NAD(P)H-dependent oxidoreductase subunit E [Pseudomonadota bacterium]